MHRLRLLPATGARACALLLLAYPALAQDKPFAAAGATVSLAATTASGRVQIQAGPYSGSLRIYNAGAASVFIACGDASVVATVAAGVPIAPGTVEVLGCSQTYIAGI